MPFERFLSKIETTKENEDIQNWLQQMSRSITYIPKNIDETVTDLEPLHSLENVKNYLLKYYRDRILREVVTIRVAGINCENILSTSIARTIQFFLQRQRHFPLETANNLRNRFRRVGFCIYRRGKNSITYVCAVKRKFRTDADVFEPKTQALIAFLEPFEKIDLMTVKKNYIELNNLPEMEVLGILNWLIREGYIVAYENGTLFLTPKLLPKQNFIQEKIPQEKNVKDISPEGSIIPLGMEETAIEKFSDGTITVTQQTTLAFFEDMTQPDSVNLQNNNNQSPENLT
jgi:hypothetical protein